MSLVGQINSLATRTGAEIKAVRGELAAALALKAPVSHTHVPSDLQVLTGSTVPSATTFYRGDGQWIVPTNTTYSALSLAEFTTGTATTSRAVSALLLNQEINQKITGDSTIAPGAFGQTLARSANVAAAKASLALVPVDIAGLQALLDSKTPKNRIVFHIDDFGGNGNASFDNTDAINAAIAAMSTTGSNGLHVLRFGAGQYNFSNFVAPAKSIGIEGAGQNITELRPINGTTGDFIKLPGSYSMVRDLTINGRATVVTGLGDALVIDSPRAAISNVRIQDCTGDGLAVGKGGSAIGIEVHGFAIKNAYGYGVRIYGDYVSTDGIWLGGDIGQTGKSCVRIDAAAHNMALVHVWGGGMRDATDAHGFWIRGRRQVMSGCQAETNMGHGFLIDGTSDGHHFVGSAMLAFGNMLSGLKVDSANYTNFAGTIERNGVSNPGNNQSQYSGVLLTSAADSIINVMARDGQTSIPSIAAPSGAAYSYPGRDGSNRTQTYGVQESGASNRNLIHGYIRGEDHRSTQGVLLIGGQSICQAFMGQNSNNAVPSVASSASFTIPPSAEVVEVTGGTQITAITSGKVGRTVTLVFTASTPAGISAAAIGVRLNGGYAPSQNGAIMLTCVNGGSWAEVSRSDTFISAASITDSTVIGRSVLTAADQASARSAIGAGTSSLVIGSGAGQAVAGNDPRLTDARNPTAHTHTVAQITDSTAVGRSVLAAADAAAARTAIGAGTGNSNLALGTTSTTAKAGDYQPTWGQVTGRPTTFPPETHSHAIGDVTNLSTTLAAKADLVGGLIPQAQLPAIAVTEFLGTVASQSAMLALSGQRGDWCTRTDLGTDWTLIAEPASTLANWRERSYPTSPVTSVAGRVGAITLTSADITDSTTVGRNVLKATDAAAARSAIGAGTSSLAIGTTSITAKAGDYAPAWGDVTGKPSTFAPAAHSHAISEVTSLQSSLDAKAPLASPAFTGAPTVSGVSIVLGNDAKLYDARKALSSDNGTASAVTTWYGTQAQYDAIVSKDAATEYNIYA